MVHPFPLTQWEHHTPLGLKTSSTAATLQHKAQVPQSRPATTRDPTGGNPAVPAEAISGAPTAIFMPDSSPASRAGFGPAAIRRPNSEDPAKLAGQVSTRQN